MPRAPKETIPPEPPAADAPEHVRAHWWRVHVAKLARPALADQLGKSAAYIQRMEGGEINGRPIEAAEYAMYRLACAAISAGVKFDWISTTLEIAPGVTVNRSSS
jgi:hypothetical protein